MAVPATTGQLREHVEDMELGDYIKCGAVRGGTIALTTVYNFGIGAPATSGEIPVSGLGTTAGLGGTFYFVKVDKGLLIADRVIFNSITWDQLNSKQWIEGVPFESGVIRSLSGGISFADVNGNKTSSNGGFGAFPIINEWDRYITNFPIGFIQAGNNLDDVFHFTGIYTAVKDTNINYPNTWRTVRGYTIANFLSGTTSSTSHAMYGFRPVFEYKEV